MVATKIISVDQAVEAKPNYGDALLVDRAQVMITIPEANVSLPLHVEGAFLLGRQEVASPHKLDLDLSPYGAHIKGVSRIHAAIQRVHNTLSVLDLGSKNGTFLNGERLPPHQPRLLRNGDEVRLGSLILQLHFEPPTP